MPIKNISLKSIRADKPLGLHYRVQFAAWSLGKSTKWVKQKIESGALDGYLLDGDIVVSLESINRYLEITRITGQAKAEAEEPEPEAED